MRKAALDAQPGSPSLVSSDDPHWRGRNFLPHVPRFTLGNATGRDY